MSDEQKRGLYWVFGIVVAIFVVFAWPHTDTWDGDGTINAFPSADSVKNYRLDANMTVTRKWHGWFGKGTYTYTDIQGQWPNGGTLDIEDCTILDTEQADCTDQDSRSYGIEVVSSPDEPESDSGTNDY